MTKTGPRKAAWLGALAVAGLTAGLLAPSVAAGATAPATGGSAAGTNAARTGALARSADAVVAALPACNTTAPPTCYSPRQVLPAYGFTPGVALTGAPAGAPTDGTGTTIAFIESFGSPNVTRTVNGVTKTAPAIYFDLAAFDSYFKIPAPPSLKVIQPVGSVPKWGTDPDMPGWAAETTLDIEWAHAMAPGAKLLLVETPVSETEGTTGLPQMMKALDYVVNNHLANVVSMSFGATEQTIGKYWTWVFHRSIVNAYNHHVTVVASSGDTGATDYQLNLVDLYASRVIGWPASDPYVTAVGGTQLHLKASGTTPANIRASADTVWHDQWGASGGGRSAYFLRQGYQHGVRGVVGTMRGIPDISMSGAVQPGGVVYYHTFPGMTAGWDVVGGTSESAPLFAGLVARADAIALKTTGKPLGFINPMIYGLARYGTRFGFADVVSGNNSWRFTNSNGRTYTVTGWSALTGYDLASGVGTINDGWAFVKGLAAQAPRP